MRRRPRTQSGYEGQRRTRLIGHEDTVGGRDARRVRLTSRRSKRDRRQTEARMVLCAAGGEGGEGRNACEEGWSVEGGFRDTGQHRAETA